MKKTFCILLAALLLFSVPACRKEEKEEVSNPLGDATVTFGQPDMADGAVPEWKSWLNLPAFDYENTDLSGYIRVGKWEGLSVTKAPEELTDEEFENEIDAMLNNYSHYTEITDRAVEEGDTVRADYAGYLNGEAFQGGTAKNQEITASPGTGYIEGFAEAFIGQMPGEEFSFNVTFPENYGVETLNGQEVTFVCTVHAIVTDELIVPVLDEEFVSQNFSYDSVEEFREAYRKTVQRQKAYYVNSQVYTDLWQQILADSEMLVTPETEVNRIYAEQRSSYESYAQYYETDYETFLTSYMNTTDEAIRAGAEDYVKEDLTMYALVKELGIRPTDEEYAEGIRFYAEYNGMSEDEILDYYGEDALKTSVLWQKLMERIAQDAVITVE